LVPFGSRRRARNSARYERAFARISVALLGPLDVRDILAFPDSK
jgi:hypothetical protein